MRRSPGRSYRFFTGTPLWPFGYSLSYTQWVLSWANQMPKIVSADVLERGVELSVNLTNTGQSINGVINRLHNMPSSRKSNKHFKSKIYCGVKLFRGQRRCERGVEGVVVFCCGEVPEFEFISSAFGLVSAADKIIICD